MPKEIIIEVSTYTRKVLTLHAANMIEVEIQQLTDDKWVTTERRQIWKDEYKKIKEVWG